LNVFHFARTIVTATHVDLINDASNPPNDRNIYQQRNQKKIFRNRFNGFLLIDVVNPNDDNMNELQMRQVKFLLAFTKLDLSTDILLSRS